MPKSPVSGGSSPSISPVRKSTTQPPITTSSSPNNTGTNTVDRETEWLELTGQGVTTINPTSPNNRPLRRKRNVTRYTVLTPDHARDVYNLIIQGINKDPEALDDPPSFGGGVITHYDHPISQAKLLEARRILCALQRTCDIEYCPLLLDLIPLLLQSVSEPVAFSIIRNMYERRPFYFGTCRRYFLAAMEIFREMLHKYFHETGALMTYIAADSDCELRNIFERALVPLLPYQHVLRVMELYMTEGFRVFFRVSLALIKSVKWKLKLVELETAELWWGQLVDLSYSTDFDMEEVLGDMLDFKFRRKVLQEEIAVMMKLVHDDDVSSRLEEDVAPMEMVQGSKSKLLTKRMLRKALAKFLPVGLRYHKLKVVYENETHGRSLATLYQVCRYAKPVILLIQEESMGNLIGAYCSDPITTNHTVSGSGEDFLFRLHPMPVCYRWFQQSTTNQVDVFQMATHEFFAVGVGGGTDHPGLQITKDLDNGSSHPCATFDNQPLCGKSLLTFHVSRIEVLQLVPSLSV